MKHRAETKRRFWPVVVAAVLIAVAAGGTTALVRGSGQHGASLTAAVVTPAVRQAQVLAALKHRARPPVPQHWHKHKSKHKPKRRHGHCHGHVPP